jgi:Leucine-rich repeat (LRR) protein
MTLELSGNQLTRVDDFIESMQMLKELDLSGNMITHVSDAIGSLPKLEVCTI